jgi:cell division protein FtsQ
MAAVVRGGPPSRPKPRAKAPAAPAGRAPAASKQRGYSPGKLAAVQRSGLHPRIALAVALGVFLIAMIAALASGHRPQMIAGAVGAGLDRQLGSMGLRVRTLTVQGVSPMAQADIVRASAIYRDEPIVGLDLKALRQRIEQVGWVKDARVVRLLPDAILIDVTPRETLAVWQHAGQTQVVDNEGRVISEADPGRFADLPLVVGDGANEAAAAILPSVRSRPRLMQRLEALVRVDDRRWDLRMKDGGLIQLPAVGEDSALIQLDQLDQKSRILELGFARIDLRDPEMVAVRPRDAAVPGQLVAGGA